MTFADTNPIAYTYDADHHCPDCTVERFGSDANGWPPQDATDSEGNPLGTIAPWDEWQQGTGDCETLACADCHTIIDTAHRDLFGEWCQEDDTYDSCIYDVDNPVIVRDTGGSIPRTNQEWIYTILADAESVGAKVAKIREELEEGLVDADEDPDDTDYVILDEWLIAVQQDIEEAINDTADYVVVADGDSQSWVVYKRKNKGVAA